MDYISTLINAGADAMTNMYEVKFTLPPNLRDVADGDVQSLTIRTDGFTPPTPAQAKYPVHWKTVSIDRPSSKINLSRAFPITFRVDAYYRLYKLLLAWHAMTSNPSTGFASNYIGTGNTGIVEVKALDKAMTADIDGADGIAESTVGWKYYDVWIESITPPTYSTSSTDPSRVTVNFVFGKFEDPQKNAYVVR